MAWISLPKHQQQQQTNVSELVNKFFNNDVNIYPYIWYTYKVKNYLITLSYWIANVELSCDSWQSAYPGRIHCVSKSH